MPLREAYYCHLQPAQVGAHLQLRCHCDPPCFSKWTSALLPGVFLRLLDDNIAAPLRAQDDRTKPDMSDAKGRVAIKFGASSASRPPPPSSLGKRPRPHALGGASDSEDDDDRHGGRHEAITGFGTDGAESERKSKEAREVKKEYVIERQGNRDWRTEMKAQRQNRGHLPPGAQQQNGSTAEREPADQEKEGLKWGLTFSEKKDTEDEPSEEVGVTKADTKPEPRPDRTADDEAMDALLGKIPKSEKVIEQTPTEDDIYQRDAAEAGATSTLADYEAMPVEEFGAALLRGMGWDGEHRGPKTKEVRKRQNRLGLGAKELKGAEDLGGWSQNGAKKRSRPRLADYRREETKRKEGRHGEDSYKREKERERERDGYRDRDRHRERDRDRHRGHRDDYSRDRRR